MIILKIIDNLALLALISIVSGFVRKRCSSDKSHAVVQGVLFGGASVVGMLFPVVLAPGLFYDGRSIMLGLCGLFFGPVAVAIAGSMTLAARLLQGGQGMLVGSLVILSASLVGALFHRLRGSSRSEPSIGELALFGILIHVLMILTMLALPAGVSALVIRKMALPVLVAYPLVTVLIGTILADQCELMRYLSQLRASEGRFRATLYSIGDGVIMTDGSGRIGHMNLVAERLTGWREDAAKGRPSSEIFRLVDEQTRNAEPDPAEQILRGGPSTGVLSHSLLVTRDGAALPVASRGAPIRDDKGGVVGVVLVFRDLTEERAVQQNLVHNEARVRSLIEHAPIGVFTSTSDGRMLMLNDAMARILGYPSADKISESDPAIEKPFYTCPDRRDEFFQRLKKERQVKGYELELMTVDRRRIWVSMTAGMIELHMAGGCLVEGFCIEITERKKAELELIRNAERMNVMLRILLYPAKDEQELLNYALEEMLSLTGSKIGFVGHYDESSKRFVMSAWSKEAMKQCAVADPPTVYELDETGLWGEAIRQRHPVIVNDFKADLAAKKGVPPGHVALSRFLAVPIFQDEKIVGVVAAANKEDDYGQEEVIHLQVLLGSVWKEVARLRMKKMKDELEKQLHQAQKMESVGRLAGGVAHDFNNILQAMLGHSELLLERLPETGQESDLIREVISEGRRAANLTGQLLAFARRQPINPQVLSINETVESMLKLLRRLLGEDIELHWHPGQHLWPIKIDPGQLDQILANLTVNARDAIAGNGTMVIQTFPAVLDERYCMTHVDATPGKYVVLSVGDNGCGMSKETMARLFEPFFTTKPKGKGTGLGLATVYGIVRQNNGMITVESEPGKGASFKIYLPAFFEEAASPRVADVPAAPPATRDAKTVLVVDDEESLLYSGRMLLESLGYDVLTANGPVEALQLSESYPNEIHALLTDVVMPQMSGRTLAERLHEQRPLMKSIFMSGYTADVIAQHGVLEEDILYLQKPFTKAALGAKIREALARV